MEIEIFDVDHGACALGTLPTGYTFLIDAGHSSTGLRPSMLLPARGIFQVDGLFVTNYDEDHVSDLPGLRQRVDIRLLFRNTSITGSQLRSMKLASFPILGPGITTLTEMMDTYTLPIEQTLDVHPSDGLCVQTFYNPFWELEDTNNKSLVVFIEWGTTCMLFPGDLGRPGWLALLSQPTFQVWLRRVDIMMASHHGRRSGYCPEVFEFAWPDIILASDCSVRYDTQEVDYAQHARGIPWNNGPDRRYYLTTRCDGCIKILVNPSGGYHIQAGV